MSTKYLNCLFQFGTPALYFDSTGKTITCRIFIDIGWRESIPGYESHTAEIITLISILLEDVPVPKIGDQIQVDDALFTVISVHAQDDQIAALHVKKI